MSPTPSSGGGESLWPRLAQLPLVVEACEYDRLHAVLAYDFKRYTTHVRLVGAGTEGLGEDVSAFEEDGTTLHEARPALPLEGEWTSRASATTLPRSSCGRSLLSGTSRSAFATGRSSRRRKPDAIDPLHPLLHPLSPGHLLGTDSFGRDIFSRILYGGRIDLLIAFGATSVTAVVGTVIGLASGYSGGWVDTVIMRIVDLFFAFPFFVLVIAIVAMLGPSIFNMFVAIWLTSWISYARIIPRAHAASPSARSTRSPPARWATRTGGWCCATSCPTSSRT